KRGEDSDIHHRAARASLEAAELDEAEGLVRRLAAALEPLESAATATCSQDFAGFAVRHWEAVGRAGADRSGQLFTGQDATALAALFDEIAENVESFAVSFEDYPELFAAVIADQVVRRPGAPGKRIRIYGQLEARLTSADRVII